MDLNFFLGMDRKNFEKGLKPIKKGYNPKKNDIIIIQYPLMAEDFAKRNICHIITNFEDGTTERGWGIFYDIYDFEFTNTKIVKLEKRVEGHDYQYPHTYEDWIWHYRMQLYVWNDNKNFYLNWKENPFEVK